ncbi:MAG: hypothetical protein LBM02_08925 [Lachnospiraceae bacterium]|jgi:hypothetical protein|nr:hypothetical protein [Lachnospiraceae bacterium]
MTNHRIENLINKIKRVDEKIANIKPYEDLKSKQYNKLVKEKLKYISIINEDIELATQIYSELLLSDNKETLIQTSTDCLRIGIFVEKATQILEEIAGGEFGLNRVTARSVLDVYNGKYLGKHL